MTVQPDDQFVVYDTSESTTSSVEQQNVQASVQDDDLMLVCRNGVPYKVTYEVVKEGFGPTEQAPSLSSVSLTQTGSGWNDSTFTTVLNGFNAGVPAADKQLKATVTGELSIAGETSPITGVGDGNLLIDKISTIYGFATANPKENALDGNLSSIAKGGGPGQNQANDVITLDLTGLGYSGTVEVYCRGVFGFSVNAVSYTHLTLPTTD